MSKNNSVDELPEDMEVISPGQILAEGRNKKSLTQQQVAQRLNFRVSLVNDIESDKFDPALPDTYHRGYLRNYAKLVNVSVADVLASYEVLNAAHIQQAEMHSFSKGTKKQAENSRLMWVSYFILVLLIGLTVMWWLQGEKISEQFASPSSNSFDPAVTQARVTPKASAAGVNADETTATSDNIVESAAAETLTENQKDTSVLAKNISELTPQVDNNAAEQLNAPFNSEVSLATLPVDVEFQFLGDCWVNIYDASGEHIAWGIKKSGYLMKISGQAPFDITLGKPELVDIVFDGKRIDMSAYRVGQIAKFTLPETP